MKNAENFDFYSIPKIEQMIFDLKYYLSCKEYREYKSLGKLPFMYGFKVSKGVEDLERRNKR